jgi:hypothetical protein
MLVVKGAREHEVGRRRTGTIVLACLLGACGGEDGSAAVRKKDRQTESTLVFVGTAIERYLAETGSLPPMATYFAHFTRQEG